MKWKCNKCGCISDSGQAFCPNGCTSNIDFEKENKSLKQRIRILKDKLYDKNRSLNRLYDEGFEKVDLGDR